LSFSLALSLFTQSTPSLLLSLLGLIFTGQLLDHVARWHVFHRVDELFILVPVLGNLKGNLETVLGARLATVVSFDRTEGSHGRVEIHR
jgi:solute carrier family 41